MLYLSTIRITYAIGISLCLHWLMTYESDSNMKNTYISHLFRYTIALLSDPLFNKLAKYSYAAYIVHVLVIAAVIARGNDSLHGTVTIIEFTYLWFVTLITTAVISWVLCDYIEPYILRYIVHEGQSKAKAY